MSVRFRVNQFRERRVHSAVGLGQIAEVGMVGYGSRSDAVVPVNHPVPVADEDIDILVLDEAASDLDANIERRIQDGIEEMSQEYTILAIAHRLSTVRDADWIYTLEDGTIAERGEHWQLLEIDGTYAELYSAQ